jgi:hypothetical protein
VFVGEILAAHGHACVLVASRGNSEDRAEVLEHEGDLVVVVELKRLCPQIERVVLDAPHLVLQRQPQASARLIAEFLLRR